MLVDKTEWGAIDWEAKGYTVGEGALVKDGRSYVFFETWRVDKVEFYFNSDTLLEYLSSFEKDLYLYLGARYQHVWWASMSGKPTYVGYPITTRVWEEFLQVKGSKAQKKSWMYKRTGVRGLLCTLHDGTLYPEALTREVPVDGEYTHLPLSLEMSYFIYFNGGYFSPNTPCYTDSRGVSVPLPYIISNANDCEEHGWYVGGECPICAQTYPIHSYSTRAEGLLSFKDEGEAIPQYMGIELEYEDCLSQVKAVYQALDKHAILKRDGSIHNGFEIVTAPATLAVHKKAFKGFYEKFSGSALSNCGMHVHVGKKGLNEMQIGKLLAFLYSKENIPHVEKIAGRSYSTNAYCKATSEKKVTSGISSSQDYSSPIYRSDDGKYTALNLSPSATIEFRIFAPPTDEVTLFSRLEFVQALMDWTKPAVCSVKDAVSWEKFLDFVGFYKKSYPNLVDTLFGKKAKVNVWVDEHSLAA